MSDYRVKITIRNERILSLIEKAGYTNRLNGFVSVRKFCETNNINYQRMTHIIAGKLKPFTLNGEMIKECEQMLEVLNVTLEDCFTERQLQGFNQRSFTLKMKESEMQQIANPMKNHEQKLIEGEATGTILKALVKRLKPRECNMVIMRFGLDNQGEKSIAEIAEKYGISRTRVDQIIKTAQRKMKHPKVMSMMLNSGIEEAFNVSASVDLKQRCDDYLENMKKKHGDLTPDEFLDLCDAKNNNKLN